MLDDTMPIYEYACPACGTTREVLHKISESPEVLCVNCPDQVLQRWVSAAAFRLKGGGWYETDFKSDKDTQRNLAGDKAPATAGDAPPAAAAPAANDSKATTPAPAPAPIKSGSGGDAAA